MEFLAHLRDDHAMTETMLRVLEACVRRFDRNREVHPDMLRGVLDYFQRFVVACHLAKEERILFPSLMARSAEAATVRALEAQHQAVRARIEDLVAAVPARTRPAGGARGEFARRVRTLDDVLRTHQWFEISWLTDAAAALLDEAGDEAIAAGFARIERETIGGTGREWFKQAVADYRDIVSTWPD